MRILSLEDQSVEYTFLTMAIDGGSADDAPGKAGTHQMLGNTLLRCRRYDRIKFQKALDRLGADCTIRSGRQYTFLEAEVLSRNLEELLGLLKTLIQSPRLEANELEKQKRIALAELEQVRDSDEELVAFLHGQFVWEGHSYGRSSRGDQHSIAAITVQDLEEAWALQKTRASSYWVGLATCNATSARVGRDKVSHPSRRPLSTECHHGFRWTGVEVLVVDRRDRNQADLLGATLMQRFG